MKTLQLPILARKVGLGCVPLNGASVVVTFVEIVTCSKISQPPNFKTNKYKDDDPSSPPLRHKLYFDRLPQPKVSMKTSASTNGTISSYYKHSMEIPLSHNHGSPVSTGQIIKVTGLTSGTGFNGKKKKNNFSRGPMSHGSKNQRRPGSIGPGTTPGNVKPGTKMPGRRVAKKRTVYCEFLSSKENLLVLRGGTPGKKGSLLCLY
jgi:ribosomal protein L3